MEKLFSLWIAFFKDSSYGQESQMIDGLLGIEADVLKARIVSTLS